MVPFLQFAHNASSNLTSLAEYLGTQITDHIPESANRLSEDMIKCISAIYCKLSDPPLSHHGLSSPVSSSSPISAFSPQDQFDMLKNSPTFDILLDNPFHVEGLKEFSGPYSTMVEVPWIYRDSQKLIEIEHLLQDFRYGTYGCSNAILLQDLFGKHCDYFLFIFYLPIIRCQVAYIKVRGSRSEEAES